MLFQPFVCIVAALGLSAHAQHPPLADPEARSFGNFGVVRSSGVVSRDMPADAKNATLPQGVLLSKEPTPRPVVLKVQGVERPVPALAGFLPNGRVGVVSAAMGNAFAVSVEDGMEGLVGRCFEVFDQPKCSRFGLPPDTAMRMVLPLSPDRLGR